MASFEERRAYFLTLARLLADAGAYLESDAADPQSAAYGDYLDELRQSLGVAVAASSGIVASIKAGRNLQSTPQSPQGHGVLPRMV